MHETKLHSVLIWSIVTTIILSGCSIDKTPTEPFPSPTLGLHPMRTQTPYSVELLSNTTPSISINLLAHTLSPTPLLLTPSSTSTALSPIMSTPSPTAVQPSVPWGWIAFNSDMMEIVSTDGLTWEPIQTIASQWPTEPKWSPDGHWLAFAYGFGHESVRSQIGIIRPDGSGMRQVTTGDRFKFSPAWSPDGILIAYAELVDGISGDIVLTRVDGTASWKLTSTPEDEQNPVWSPDGQKIAFIAPPEGQLSRMSAQYFIFEVDKDGKNRRQVSDVPTSGAISWSPDGRQIAFASVLNGYDQIFVVNVSDSSTRILTNFSKRAYGPTWSPDGNYIAFIGVTNPEGDPMRYPGCIYLFSLGDGVITKLNIVDPDHENQQYTPRAPHWSPVPALQTQKSYAITEAGDNLNLREAASLSSTILKKLKTDDVVMILEGPIDTENYYWWRMRTADGTEGWAVEVAGWYELAAPTTTPTP